MTGDWLVRLEALWPCPKVLAWARSQRDPQTAWERCKRGDWMLWFVGRLSGPPGSPSRKRVVRTALACARLSPPCDHAETERVRQECFRAIAQYVRGRATLDQLQAAADNALEARVYASARDNLVIYAAACAANTAYADCAEAVADTAYFVIDNVALATNDTRAKIMTKCAVIVRKYYPRVPRLPKVEVNP